MDDDDEALPERLRQRLLEDGFANRVTWLKLEVSLYGGHPRFKRLLPKWKDELLIAALQEQPVYGAELAAYFEGEDLAHLRVRVRDSGDLFAIRALAKSRPELAQGIQDDLVEAASKQNNGPLHPPARERLDAAFLESFLYEVPGTNPVPIQHWIAMHADGDVSRLVEMTVRLPHRTSLFATIALLLLKTRDPVSGQYMARLCQGRPEALPILEKCLFELDCTPTTFIGVCSHVSGIDLDKMEEFIFDNWKRIHQKQFCDAVKRERGPMRDWLAVEHVMES